MRKKRTPPEAPAGVDPNLGLAISLFIIILAFFIMLNAISVVNENRKRLAIGSLMENFGILSGGDSLTEGAARRQPGRLVSPVVGLSELNERITGDDKLLEEVIITADRHRSAVSIPETRLFISGETTLIPESYPLLEKITSLINKNPYPVDVMGHIDNVDGASLLGNPAREISVLQAMAVQAFFLEKGKVPSRRLIACGWGEFRPMLSSSTRETRRLNCRVEIVFVHEPKQKEPEGAFTFKDFFFIVFEKKKE